MNDHLKAQLPAAFRPNLCSHRAFVFDSHECRFRIGIPLLLLFFFAAFNFPFTALEAQNHSPKEKSLSNCSSYKAKSGNTPVYSEASTTAAVKGQLLRGETVCYIGEVNGFAILDWGAQKLIRKDTNGDYDGTGYVKLSALWEPDRNTKSSPLPPDKQNGFAGIGGIPEDPLWVLRPFLGDLLTPHPCEDPNHIGCQKAEEREKGN